jgi:hypothetical protein
VLRVILQPIMTANTQNRIHIHNQEDLFITPPFMAQNAVPISVYSIPQEALR